MSIEIDVLNGDASWPLAEPLFNAVWPPHVVAKLPWAGIVFAHANSIPATSGLGNCSVSGTIPTSPAVSYTTP